MTKINKKDLIWYFILGLTLFVFVIFIKFQRKSVTDLSVNGTKTTGYCSVKQTNLLSNKQKQLISWVYIINGKEHQRKKTKTALNKLQNHEYYTIYYNPDNIEQIYVDYTEFVLKGEYLNTETVLTKKDVFNKKNIFFKYIVDGIEYERYQKVKFDKTDNLNHKYLVKHNVTNPKIGYIYLDSIR